MGDLGLVAKASRSSQSMIFKRPDALSISKVLDSFRLIAKVHCLFFFLNVKALFGFWMCHVS